MLYRARSMPVALAALVAAGVLTAACGGGGGEDDGVASLDEGSSEGESAQSDEEAQEEELLDWVRCMRDEGVEISDPTRDENGDLVIEGPGIRIGTGGGATGAGPGSAGDAPDPEGPADEVPIDGEDMEAATEACGHPPALGGEFSEEDQQAMQDAALEFAECMRDEGIEDFPDPDFSGSGPGGQAQTREETFDPEDEGQTVVIGPFGEIDMDDPEVAAAFEACQEVLETARPDAPGAEDEGSGG